jgi:hypothetical protein
MGRAPICLSLVYVGQVVKDGRWGSVFFLSLCKTDSVLPSVSWEELIRRHPSPAIEIFGSGRKKKAMV